MLMCRRASSHVQRAVLAVLLLAVSSSADAQTAYEFKVLANDLCQVGSPALNNNGQVAFATSANSSCPQLPAGAQIIRVNVGEFTKIFGTAGQTEFNSLGQLAASLDDAGTVVFDASMISASRRG